MNRMTYVDNAATTCTSCKVLAAMEPWLRREYGNPSSVYAMGRKARQAVETARVQLAGAIGAQPGEVFFTSGGTEADNWAIKGVAGALSREGKGHLITTNFEHHAVLHTVAALERCGCRASYLPVNADGLLSPAQVSRAVCDKTALVSVMFANNEIGTVQPIKSIGQWCREQGVVFHTDAVQAVGHLPVNVEELSVDLLSLSAHKFHGPKGVGALYVRKDTRFPVNFMDGGAQERGARAGTENVAGIVGLGAAAEEAVKNLEGKTRRITAMRDALIDGLLAIPRTRLNGHRHKRLPGNVNVSFQGVDGSALLAALDAAGICASTGSACSAGSGKPSHVLTAIGLPDALAQGSLRLTLGEYNTMEDVKYILRHVTNSVRLLRTPAYAG